MARLNKDDLAQMSKHYFESLEKKRLVEVAANLHQKCDRTMGKIRTEFSKFLSATLNR